MNLSAMKPRPELASSHYCLANPGEEYLVFLPKGGSSGSFSIEWFFVTTI